MNCEIFKILYLRANTEVACNCGSGEQVNLGWAKGEDEWSATRLFENAAYAHMSEAFQRNEMPWGDICRRCVFLRPNEKFYNGLAEKKLEKIHVEPSLACALRCPGCSRVRQAKERKGPVFLPIKTYRRMLRSLLEEEYSIGYFFFCGQGEPLSHPELEALIAASRESFPSVPVIINTNGNYRFSDVFSQGQYPDKLIVSIDGLNQLSYEQYRINGDVTTALQFMQDAKNAPGKAPAVEWKYILFRYDDSDEELIAAQRKAEELGIDSLQFVLTHTPEKSRRFTPENIEELPIVSPLAYPETTPHLYFRRPLAKPISATNSAQAADFSGAGQIHCVVDECRYWSGRLFLRGWAMGVDGRSPSSLEIRVNGSPMGQAHLGLVRRDVSEAFPQLANRTAGFSASCDIPHAADGEPLSVTLDYRTPDGRTFPFHISYELEQSGAAVFNDHCP